MATTRKYREGLRRTAGTGSGTGPWKALGELGRERPLIWLHAVSVGEVLAASRLVGELDRALPGYQVVISTTTRTGQELARERFGPDRVFYCPLDLPWAVRAYLNALQPRLLVLAETEFWPNLLSGCFRRRNSRRGGQCPHLRPLLAALPAAAQALAAVSGAAEPGAGAERDGCGTAQGHRLPAGAGFGLRQPEIRCARRRGSRGYPAS